MTELVDQALRRLLTAERQQQGEPAELAWTTVRGDRRPAVDVNDRKALYDLMDDQSAPSPTTDTG